MKNNQRLTYIINIAGFSLISGISIAYSIFYRRFAELHIMLPGFSFPIFIGEIILFINLLLLFVKFSLNPVKITKIGYLLLVYFAFVLVKTGVGYLAFGPLACRHSALFYYPIFIIFGYFFYNKYYFSRKLLPFLIIGGFLIYRFVPVYEYFSLAYLLLISILIMALPSKGIKYLCFVLLLVVIPFKSFFEVSRMMLLSNFLAFLYLLIFLVLFSKFKNLFKICYFVFALFFLVSGILVFGDRNAIKSLVNFKEITSLFHEYNQQVINSEQEFVSPNLKISLYTPEGKKWEKYNLMVQETMLHPESVNNSVIEKTPLNGQSVLPLVAQPKPKPTVLPKPSYRNLTVANNNFIFRIFIWRDMWNEFNKLKPILGFSFGKPFRSRSIEILGWGSVEWANDGWVAMHNSYFDIIYRSGIIGVILLGFVFVLLIKIIKKSLSQKKAIGIFLTAIIINWFVAANFLEIFELPYTAIPLWSLFGMTYAYLFKPRDSII